MEDTDVPFALVFEDDSVLRKYPREFRGWAFTLESWGNFLQLILRRRRFALMTVVDKRGNKNPVKVLRWDDKRPNLSFKTIT